MKHQFLSTFLLALLLSLLLLLGAPAILCAQQNQVTQDVLLLIDNSGSMWDPRYGAHDIENWRFRAAEVVFNFMRLRSEPGVIYRIGVISYAERAVSLWDIREVNQSQGLVQILEDNERGNLTGSYTDHAKALQLAADQLERLEQGARRRSPVIILLTDGNLRTSGRPQEEFEKDLKGQMERLRAQGAAVHVLLFGREASATQEEWDRLGVYLTEPVWESKELPRMYHELISRVTGSVAVALEETTQAKLQLQAEQAEQDRIPVELAVNLDENERELIDEVIVTVVSLDPTVRVTFCHWKDNTCGEMLVPQPGEVKVIPGQYVTTWKVKGSDLLSGEWRVKILGEGKVAPTLLISYVPLRFLLTRPDSQFLAVPDEPIPVEATYLQGDFPRRVPENVEVYAYLCSPPSCTPDRFLSKPVLLVCEESACTGSLTPPKTGPVQVAIGARLRLSGGGDKPFLSPTFSPSASGVVLRLPEIQEVLLTPSGHAEPGEPISVTVRIVPGSDIQDIKIWMRVVGGQREILRRDLMPFSPREWGLSEPFVLPEEGNYQIIVEGSGLAGKEGIPFGVGTSHPLTKEMGYEIRMGGIGVQVRTFTEKVERGGKVKAEVRVTPEPGINVQEVCLYWENGAFSPFCLHDDGLGPDRLAGDGIWSGEDRAPSQKGTYQLALIVAGNNRFGVEVRTSPEKLDLQVVPPWYSLERIWPYGLAFLIFLIIGIIYLIARPVPPLVGTLSVYLPGGRVERHDLGQFIRPITIGFEQGTIPLPAPSGSSPGLKVRLEGRWERTPFGREPGVWLRPLKGSRVTIAGSPVDRRGLPLSDGLRVDIEGVILEYRR